MKVTGLVIGGLIDSPSGSFHQCVKGLRAEPLLPTTEASPGSSLSPTAWLS